MGRGVGRVPQSAWRGKRGQPEVEWVVAHAQSDANLPLLASWPDGFSWQVSDDKAFDVSTYVFLLWPEGVVPPTPSEVPDTVGSSANASVGGSRAGTAAVWEGIEESSGERVKIVFENKQHKRWLQ
eukprot:4454770-Pyramimonas_sp.AAC.1